MRKRMHELSIAHPRYGYRRIATLLRDEGWRVGKRHIQRLRRMEGLRVPPTKRKRVRQTGGRKENNSPRSPTPLTAIHRYITLAPHRAESCGFGKTNSFSTPPFLESSGVTSSLPETKNLVPPSLYPSLITFFCEMLMIPYELHRLA
jgi:hypothetical protein